MNDLRPHPDLERAPSGRVLDGSIDAQQLGLRSAHPEDENLAVHVHFEVAVGDPAAEFRHSRRASRPQPLDGRASPFHLARIVSA